MCLKYVQNDKINVAHSNTHVTRISATRMSTTCLPVYSSNFLILS